MECNDILDSVNIYVDGKLVPKEEYEAVIEDNGMVKIRFKRKGWQTFDVASVGKEHD